MAEPVTTPPEGVPEIRAIYQMLGECRNCFAPCGSCPTASRSAVSALAARLSVLERALSGLLDRYVELVESGDCGFWDAEAESEVIAAREAVSGVGRSEEVNEPGPTRECEASSVERGSDTPTGTRPGSLTSPAGVGRSAPDEERNGWTMTTERVTPIVCSGCGVKYLVGPVWCDKPECPVAEERNDG